MPRKIDVPPRGRGAEGPSAGRRYSWRVVSQAAGKNTGDVQCTRDAERFHLAPTSAERRQQSGIA